MAMKSWPLFDRIRSIFRSASIYRHENIFQDQSSLDRVTRAGEFLNFANNRGVIDQTNLQINRLERYKDFDQMDEVGEINLALDMYADEASLIDPEEKHAVMVKSSSRKVKESVEEFLHDTVMIDHWLRPWVRYLCKYGDLALEIIPTRERDGVASLRHMNIYNFTRMETPYGDLIGFFYQEQSQGSPEFFHPWQVMHCRLQSLENIYKPYGRSILDGARKHFKQLRLMEDAALIYRITRAPEKRVFTIPVGNMPSHEVSGYMVDIARSFKKKQFFDPSTGDVNERWHPLIQEDDFWMPVRADGSQPTVDTLPGAENLDQIADIEYFKKKMVAALKIPFSRVGIGEGQEGDSKPLAQSSPEFAKAVQWIQREVSLCLKKVVLVHLVLMGCSTDELKDFELYMTASSAIDALYRMEWWQTRADVIDSLKGTELFSDSYLLEHFTPLTEEEIEEMEEERRLDAELQSLMAQEMGDFGMGGGMGGMGGMGGGLGDMAGVPPPGGGLGQMGMEGKEDDDRLINESMKRRLDKQERIAQIQEHLKNIRSGRRGRYAKKASASKFASGLTYIMENCELDGIQAQTGNKLGVKPIVEESDRESVISETLKMLGVESYNDANSNGKSRGVLIESANLDGTIPENLIPPPLSEEDNGEISLS
jgi:hypothetical protein